jgi:hypothetical protein
MMLTCGKGPGKCPFYCWSYGCLEQPDEDEAMSEQDEAVKRVAGYLRRCFAVESSNGGRLHVRSLVKADDAIATLTKEPVYVPGTVEVDVYELVRIAREEPKVADVRVGHYGVEPRDTGWACD